jgi:mannose-6-phosphate isomerase-like protein (cupin superfamily)
VLAMAVRRALSASTSSTIANLHFASVRIILHVFDHVNHRGVAGPWHPAEMVELLNIADFVLPGGRTRTAKFEGEVYQSGASFFFVDNDPGQGVGLHWHPYSETWVVIDGEVTFRVGDALGDAVDAVIDELPAQAGAIVTVPPQRHHGFTNTGSGALRMMCIHAGPRIIQFDLED